MTRKLKSKKGESLPETLMAVLIAGLSLTMLAGATIGAVKASKTAGDSADRYYAEVSALDGAIGTQTAPEGTETVDAVITYSDGSTTGSTGIRIYRYADTGLEAFTER